MNNLLAILIPVLVGTVITVNGFALKTNDLLNKTKEAVNNANFHQLATVVELYYSDHDTYPDVSGGEELVNLLENEGYIRNRPLDSSTFRYEIKRNGQDYTLALKR